jgi:hypothetical protein
MIRGQGMGDVSDVVGEITTALGGPVDQLSAQLQTIKLEIKVALAASYVAGALALLVLVRRL